MALQDPSAPFSPWALPPTAAELEAAMAEAYGAQPLEVGFGGVPSLLVPATAAPPPAAPESESESESEGMTAEEWAAMDERITQRNEDRKKQEAQSWADMDARIEKRAAERQALEDEMWYSMDARINQAAGLPSPPRPRTDAARIGMIPGAMSGEEIAAAGGVVGDPNLAFPAPNPPGHIEMPDDPIERESDEEREARYAAGFENPDDRLTPEDLGEQWSGLSIEEQEKKRGAIEGARADLRQAGLIEANTRALKEAEGNARAYQEAVKRSQEETARLSAEAEKIATEKIDPVAGISTFSKVLGIAAAFVGGFNKTGRNFGLEQVDAMIADNVAAQTANLHNKKDMLSRRQNAVAEQMAMGKDLYQAQETVRIAAYDQLIRKVETDAQQYDPRGTRALKAMDAINALKAHRAELLAKYQTEQQKRIEKLLQEERERARDAEIARHNKAQEGIGWKGAKNDELRAKAELLKAEAEAGSGALLTPDELRARGIAIPPNANVPPMSLAQAKKLAETAKSVEDWQKAARENSPEERARQFSVGELVDSEGEPVQFRSTEAASKVAKLRASADLSVQLLDRLITARDQHGWSSDLFKSPEWREMQSDFAQLILEKKNLDELGVIAGPDMDLMQKALGTTDPTELRDPTSGLERIRKTTVEKTNSVIRAEAVPKKGRSIPRWEPPKPPPPPAKTPGDIEFQEALSYGSGQSNIPIAEADPARTGAQNIQAFAEGQRASGGLPATVQARIDRIARAATDAALTDDERRDAVSKLEQLAKNAESKAVRDYALRVGADPAAGAQVSTE